MALDLRGQPVRIVVADESKALPAERPADLGSTGGRGLIMVAVMAHAWGVRDREDGKTVWADVTIQRDAGARGEFWLEQEDVRAGGGAVRRRRTGPRLRPVRALRG